MNKECSKCRVKKSIDLFNKFRGECKACQKLYKESIKERCKEAKKSWYEKNKAQQKAYRDLHKQRAAIASREWSLANKERKKATDKAWAELNKARYLALTKKYKMTKSMAQPVWLTTPQHEEIADMYKQAKELEAIFFNRKFHVDHIIPLQGKDVCGLHVPWNLQILTAEENHRKSNKHG
jgi:hypothetical protein